jgi:hypothetical protein
MPLVLYHFQGLQLFDEGSASLYVGDLKLGDDLREAIYMPYITELTYAYSTIRMLTGDFKDGLIDKKRSPGGVIARGLSMLRRRRNLVRFDLSPTEQRGR